MLRMAFQVRRKIRLNPDVPRGFIRPVRLPPPEVADNFCRSPRKGGLADLMIYTWWKRIPRPLQWIGGLVLILLLLIVGASLIDWNIARGLVSRVASRQLDRRVAIGGALRVRLLSSTPSVSVDDLSIANPDWAGGGNMLEVRHLQFALQLSQLFLGHLVLATLEVDEPQLSLLRDASQRANWEFGKPAGAKSQQPARLPVIRHFALRGGTLAIADATRKLVFKGMVAANEGGGHDSAEPFRLEGQGTLNNEPFKAQFRGDALLNVDFDHPYRFRVKIDAGPSNASVSGSIAKPFDFAQFDTDIDVQGQNLANLYYLTGLALPLTAPYRISAHVRRTGMHFAIGDIVGKVGSSDLHGHAGLDFAADGRPTLIAALTSKSLNLGDLGIAVGAGVPQQAQTSAAPQLPAPAKAPISPLLLPTFQFQFDRLALMDGSVDLHADSVQTQNVPIEAVTINLKLDHGLLLANPVDFELPLGKLVGEVRLDTHGASPQAIVDVRLTDVHLDQFKGKTSSQSPLSGILQSHLHLEGHGNSVHDIAADSNGTIAAVIPQGDIRQSLAELTGINVLSGLGLLLSGNEKTAPIRCGIAEFQVKDGDAHAERLLIDTEPVVINGDGHITLSDEVLDLNITGKPKKMHLARLRAPINVRGTLRHPSIGVSAQSVVKQGAVAAAAGALLTPVAALVAFIDPGLAKDQNCAALLGGAAQ
jgi:AsmA family protein